jgi:hypothetical protein
MLSENDIAQVAERTVRFEGLLAFGMLGSYAVRTAPDHRDLDLFVFKNSAQRRWTELALFAVAIGHSSQSHFRVVR